VNGCGLGETHYGGYAERARVKGEWLVKLIFDSFDPSAGLRSLI
jgi:hypothetical protein